MKLEKHLVLNKYFLSLFGFKDFGDLIEKIKNTQEDYDSNGKSFFLGALLGYRADLESELLRYDENIKRYVQRIGRNRKMPNFSLKYFQYLALLFTEIFLHKFYNSKRSFLNELNEFLKKFNYENRTEIKEFTAKDLKKLAYWMATGSGKTLIMHINYLQILKYSKNKWDNVILIAPNEGLSKQHYEELKLSGIPCKLYDGNNDNLKTKENEILVIDIHKLTREKKGKGVTVDISYFDGKNLVFIDEGHKGQKSEEQTWKKLRETIAQDGFLFEYSATFGQIIEFTKKAQPKGGSSNQGNLSLYNEYVKSIIIDYSYKHFYTDGYGKDFYVYNIQSQNQNKKDVYSEEQQKLIFIAGLLSFYEQLLIYENHKDEVKKYNLEKPLWIFVGSKVTGKGLNSDVVKIIYFLETIIKDEKGLKGKVHQILNGKSGLIDNRGQDIFKEKFEYLRQSAIDEIVEGIFEKIFAGKGKFELFEIKNADGEIGLKTSTAEKYFGVINIGDVNALKKLLKDSNIEVKQDNFSNSLFFEIDNTNSAINLLIGSKKFVEGWNSWRVSNMGLINMGKSEGPQIIQLFGRGVRLKGQNFSLKREENPDYKIRALQTLFIFGLNADYINAFLGAIEKEEVSYEEISIFINFNNPKKWENKLYTIKTKKGFDFLNYPTKLSYNEDVLKKIKIDLRPRMSFAHGLNISMIETTTDTSVKIPQDYLNLMDWDKIYSEILNYKIVNQWFNLEISRETLKQIALSDKFKIYIAEDEFFAMGKNNTLRIKGFAGLEKFQDLILLVLKDYVKRFYKLKERQEAQNNIFAEPLTTKHSNMYPENKEIILKIPNSMVSDIKNMKEQIEKFSKGDIPEDWKKWESFAIHFDNHLYSPLVIWTKNQEQIESFPVKLNKGETQFIKDLKEYLENHPCYFGEKEVFLLRNLSKKGVGFFTNAGFYPDFILWILEEKSDKQRIIFIDPKGIRNLGNFNEDKIQFCVFGIKEIEKKVKEILNHKDPNLSLGAYIVSITPYDEIKKIFGEGDYSKEDFKSNHILFQDDKDCKYVEEILSSNS